MTAAPPCSARNSSRSAAVCEPASASASPSWPSASPGCPCSSAISASSISRGTARLGTAASGSRETASRAASNSRVSIAARAPSSADKPGRLRNRERFLRELARLAVAALEQRDHRRILLRARALDVAAPPRLAHFAGSRAMRA